MEEKTLIIDLVNKFTRPDVKRKTFVGYLLATLIYDHIRTLERIVTASMPMGDWRKSVLKKVTDVEEFFKFV